MAALSFVLSVRELIPMYSVFNRPGYYELTGPPASGKTTVGLLLAVSKVYSGHIIFVTTYEEYSPPVTEVVTGDVLPEWFVMLSKAKDFFELVSMAQPGQLVILDSLATLRPDHPAKEELASSVARHWVRPKCPVLVINQERHPVPIGGLLWRNNLIGRMELVMHRDRPFLMSELQPTGLWLTWANGLPELRLLSEDEEKLWIRGVIYNGVC